MFYSKQSVYYNSVALDQRIHNGAGVPTTALNAAQIATLKKKIAKDLNIDDRISKFQDQIKNWYVYRVPLR